MTNINKYFYSLSLSLSLSLFIYIYIYIKVKNTQMLWDIKSDIVNPRGST